jgi:hypothetical protein
MGTPNDDLHRLADELPAELAGEVVDFAERLRVRRGLPPEMTEEDRAWLDAEPALRDEPYDWGPEGPPPTRPVRYVPGVGFVIEGGRDV